MAKKITELTELTTYATNDLLIIEDVSTSTTKKITWANLIADNSITAAKVDGIDKSLLTVDSNPYKFEAYRSSAWTAATNTWGKVALNAETYDTNSNFDSTTNNRYVAPVDGFYFFSGCAGSVASNGAQVGVALYKNGSLAKLGTFHEHVYSASGTRTPSYSVASLIQLAATDYVELWHHGNAGAGTIGATLTYLTGFLLCRT